MHKQICSDEPVARAVPRLAKTDIHLLDVFITVVEAGGFSAAQVSLNVGQSTISRQMADLESRLGVRLCQRGRSGFSLTHKGRMVYKEAQKLFRSLEDFRTQIDELRGGLIGELSLAVIDNWVSDTASPLPHALSELKQVGPKVKIELHCVAPDEIERAVIAHAVDLGIGVFHQHHPSLTYQTLYDDPMEIYCGRGHSLFDEAATATADDLAGIDYVQRAYLSEERVAPHVASFTSTALAHQIEGVASLILTGRYVGYMPVAYAAPFVREDRLRPLTGAGLRVNKSIKLVTRCGIRLPSVADTFCRLLHKHLPRSG